MRVDGTLWLARGARRVNDHQRILRVRRCRIGGVPCHRHQLVPPVIAARSPRHVNPEPLQHDQVSQRRNLRRRFVSDGLERRSFSAARARVGSEKGVGCSIVQARRDRLRAETGKQGQEHPADFDDRQHRHNDLRRHWHEHANGIAFAEPERAQRVGQAIHLAAQFKVGQASRLSIFPFPNDRGLRVRRRVRILVEAVVHDVHHTADAPLRPRDPARQVNEARIRPAKANVQIVQHCVPEPIQVADRAPLQFLESAQAVFRHESPEVALRHQFRRWPPDDLAAKIKCSAGLQVYRSADSLVREFQWRCLCRRFVARTKLSALLRPPS